MNDEQSLLILNTASLDTRYAKLSGADFTGDVTTTGDVEVAGHVHIGEIWHAYGGFQNKTETIAISGANTWTHITNATNDLFTGLEGDGLTLSGDQMTIVNAGDYTGMLSMTISGTATKDFQIRLYNVTQTAQMGYVIGATTTGAGNYTNITLPLYIEASANDVFQMQIQCTTDASDPTLRSAVFYIAYLHD